MPTTFDDLQAVLKDQRFWSLDPKAQGDFISSELGIIYGEQFANRPIDDKRKMVNSFLSQNRPKGLVEEITDWIPFVGPIASQYAFGREVEASPLVRKLFGERTREAGGLWQAAEELGLFTVGTFGVAFLGGLLGAPALAVGGVALASGAVVRTIPRMALREGLVGSIYEVGKLVTHQKPLFTTEAATQVVASTALFATGGAGIEKIGQFFGERFLRGRMIRELGSRDAYEGFMGKIGQGSEAVGYDEIAAGLRAIGKSESRVSIETRESLTQLLEHKKFVDERAFATQQEELAKQRLQQQFRSEYEARVQRVNEEELLRKQQLEVELQRRGLRQQEEAQLRAEMARVQTVAELQRQQTEKEFAERVAEATRRQIPIEEERPIVVSSPFGPSEESQIMRGKTVEEIARLQRERGVEGSIKAQHELMIEQFKEIERERLVQQQQARIARQRPQAEETVVSNRSPEIEERLFAEQRKFERQAQEEVAKMEIIRQSTVNKEIAALEQGRIETSRQDFTTSERMLIEALTDEGAINQGFVGQRPISTPIGMLAENERSLVPVVVERFIDGQAVLRGGKGFVSRKNLRMPVDAKEQALLDKLLVQEGVFGAPTREEALRILRERVKAEQKVRLADTHSLREDFFENEVAQAVEFELRREATKSLINASGKQFSQDIKEQVNKILPLVGDRQIGSIERLSLLEAGELQMVLKGAGFENVRPAVGLDGKVTIGFTRTESELENKLSSLYNTYASKFGIFDATTRTYNGLTALEHRELGKGFGLGEKEVDRYVEFITKTLDDLSSRALRVPVTVETLGVAPIEKQILGKAKSPQVIRADAIVDAERVQRLEVGDSVKIPLTGNDTTVAQVSGITNEANGQRVLHLQGAQAPLMGQPLNPVREVDFLAGGGERIISAPLGREPTPFMLSIDSPARTLEALLNPERRAAIFQPFEASFSNVRKATKELGMGVSQRSSGEVTISQKGMRLQFDNVDEATKFVNSLRYWRQERERLMDNLGGRECI